MKETRSSSGVTSSSRILLRLEPSSLTSSLHRDLPRESFKACSSHRSIAYLFPFPCPFPSPLPPPTHPRQFPISSPTRNARSRPLYSITSHFEILLPPFPKSQNLPSLPHHPVSLRTSYREDPEHPPINNVSFDVSRVESFWRRLNETDGKIPWSIAF